MGGGMSAIFQLTLSRPWPWAILGRGCRVLFPSTTDGQGRSQAVRPPPGVVGHYLALQVGRGWDVEGAAFMERRLGLYVPADDGFPDGAIFAVARLSQVSTICNDSRAFGRPPEPWWRGSIAWWLDEVLAVEPLECPEVASLTPVSQDFLPELRERFTLARDGLWRPSEARKNESPAPLEASGTGQFGLGL
ncbi:conserved uncharacterized protein [Stigmatella aurantiaca DW4/3-1]|uniref:Conserved uncharacterized protein n=2 Tax=Stigmatella aurantiaca TaxID=41 RepID=Q09AV1_STIAD|nr:conserved uncharacterized protein [Stigmatella aurantiaca DW4/3-1]EAU68850.1 hypothetical protein STIAU_6897 [Stigmatella aurantiaca DW4/3-1]